jgi:hypothetical protein
MFLSLVEENANRGELIELNTSNDGQNQESSSSLVFLTVTLLTPIHELFS